MEQIVLGNIRVQLLNADTVRIEYAKNGVFFDADTFFIPDKTQYKNTAVGHTCEENVICFGDYELYIPDNASGLTGVRLDKNGKKVYSYKKLANSGELPPLDKTPEVFAVSDTPRITVPAGGYSATGNGEYTVEENVQDIYLLLCGKDAKKLRKLYVELTGRNEMVRLSTFGGWNSKYYAYSESEAKQVITDYEKHNVPLDVMVIDTDWRSCENGWGYDINETLFPDMKGFIDFAHSHGVEIMFNDHPEPVNGAQVFAPEEIEYRENNLQALMNIGLDTWWYDRNWGTHLISPSENVYWETFGLYLFADITANYYKKTYGDDKVYRRPVIMGNVVNVANGEYRTITDSASHRYSIQWTGDIDSSPQSITQEVQTLIRASNNCIAYVNADCGGHTGNPDKECFIRWMQFGTLSPVYRPHCTNNVVRFREPWLYDGETLDIVREYNNLRYRLLPVIYKNAYNNYLTGEPIFKGLGWEFPKDKTALACTDEYMLGNDILISPIGGEMYDPLVKDNYVTPVKAVFYNGRELEGDPIAITEWDKLEMDLRHVPPHKGVPVYDFSARFETVLKFPKKMRLYIKSDDGATVWVDGKKVLEDKTLHSAMLFPLCEAEGGMEHSVEIEYFQAGGEACCALYAEECKDETVKSVYLPEGEWVDVFGGTVYGGGRTVGREYDLRELPLFVRKGAVIPLAYEARNTKSQKWDRLVLDFYADKKAADAGYIYEDDTETTAYKLGANRTTAYSAEYCDKCSAFVLKLEKPQGSFDGAKCFAEREIKIKLHIPEGENVVKVTVNGVDAEFKTASKNAAVFPLNTCDASPDAVCATVTFTATADKDAEIKFFIG